MTNDDPWTGLDHPTFEEVERREASRRRRRNRAAWIVLVGLGVLVFEFTTDPAFSVAVLCLKPAWDGLRRGWRALRTDTDRARAGATAGFELAWGLWRVTLSALVVLVVVVGAVMVSEANGRPVVDPPSVFVSAILILAGGLVVSTLATVAATSAALVLGVRVWVGRDLNRARHAVLASMIAVSVPGSVAVLFLIVPGVVAPPDEGIGLVVFTAGSIFVLSVLLPIGVLFASSWIAERIEAPFPISPGATPPGPDDREQS